MWIPGGVEEAARKVDRAPVRGREGETPDCFTESVIRLARPVGGATYVLQAE